MSDLTTLFTNIADSIRTKKGTSDPIPAVNFPTEIVNLPSGGDYDSLGYEIDVEANGTIDKGDKIIAQENNQYVQPTLGCTAIPSGILSVSADLSVAIASETGGSAQTLTEGSKIYVYFRDEQTGQYDEGHEVIFEGFPTSNFLLYNTFILNEDGTLGYSAYFKQIANATYYETVFIALEIDKENKTIQYHYINSTFEHQPAGGTNPENYEATIDGQFINTSAVQSSSNMLNGNIGYAVEDYVICSSFAHVLNVPAGTYSSYNKILTIYRYNKSTHTLSLEYNFTPRSPLLSLANGDLYGVAIKVDNDIFFPIPINTTSYYIAKYDTINYNLTISGSFSSNTINNGIRLSSGVNYACHITGNTTTSTISVYQFSKLDLTFSLVRSVSISSGLSRYNAIGYTSDDGRYVYTSAGILFDTVDGVAYGINTYGSGYTSYIINQKLSLNQFVIVRGTGTPRLDQIISLSPSSNAQYIATKHLSTDCSTTDRVYGIASESLATGQRGKARALYSTFS